MFLCSPIFILYFPRVKMKTRYESCLSLILPTYLGIQFNQIEMYLEFQVWGILQMRFTKKKHCNFKDLIFIARTISYINTSNEYHQGQWFSTTNIHFQTKFLAACLHTNFLVIWRKQYQQAYTGSYVVEVVYI